MKKGFIIWSLIAVIAVAGALIGGHLATNNGGSGEYNEEQVITENKQDNATKNENKKNQETVKDNSNTPKSYTMEDGIKVYYVSGINKDLMGQTITVKCKIANVKEKKDTVFFSLRDIKNKNKDISGVMFKKTNADNAGRKELLEQAAQENATIYIDGQVDEYQGVLEVKAWKVYTK